MKLALDSFEFKVSVIIPVFQSQDFIEKAVFSALQQKETGEVILIEDGSSDDSLQICKKLVQTDTRVKLFTHPENKNYGVSASRNLGISMAQNKFIAFLDADDFFLQNRFLQTKEVFKKNIDALGVYESSNTRYIQNGELISNQKQHNFDITIPSKIDPTDLFQELVKGDWHILTNTITLNKDILFAKNILFNPKLVTGEDTDFFFRLSLAGNLFPGSIKTPIAMRVIHNNNHTHQIDFVRKKKHDLYKIWVKKSLNNSWPKAINRHFLLHLLEGKYGHIKNKIIRHFAKALYLGLVILKKPKLLLKII